MSRDEQHNPDPNENAARIVGESAAQGETPADLEAAWLEWSKGIQKVDERGMTLLRAAFEAGYEAGRIPAAAELGRRGGLKGGKSRAERLSAEQRVEIAKKAAATRWEKR
ncbi:MAG: hypothetical protein KDA42_03095 [Planctomycetales bacterium]|nr:hypothetical protein [Planctomycetales bacterium]